MLNWSSVVWGLLNVLAGCDGLKGEWAGEVGGGLKMRCPRRAALLNRRSGSDFGANVFCVSGSMASGVDASPARPTKGGSGAPLETGRLCSLEVRTKVSRTREGRRSVVWGWLLGWIGWVRVCCLFFPGMPGASWGICDLMEWS